jgi:hypothetical protein
MLKRHKHYTKRSAYRIPFLNQANAFSQWRALPDSFFHPRYFLS